MDLLKPLPCPHCLNFDRMLHVCYLRELKQGLEQRCPRCTAMHSLFEYWAATVDCDSEGHEASVRVDQLLPRLRLKLGTNQKSILLDVSLPMDGFLHPYALPESTDSANSLAQAEKWFDECVRDHKHCNSGQNHAYVPTRLIDVDDIKLVNTPQHSDERQVKYACLSHSWGGQIPDCMTTKETLPSRLEGIPTHLIPKTFADAMSVARLLGLRYIWIDSVCIIQDSAADWEKESEAMADVYSNATVTIAATGAKSCHAGLFTSPSQAYQMRQYPLSAANWSLTARPTLPHPMDYPSFVQSTDLCRVNVFPTNYYANVHPNKKEEESTSTNQADIPLLKRAWALQERFLSRRILHFTPHELMFECLHETKCQCGMQKEWFKSKVYDSWFKTDTSPLFYGPDPECQEAKIFGEKLYLPRPKDQWDRIIETYSKLDLTKASDVLPALSGAAKLSLQYRNGDTYYAGHFKATLPKSLAWYIGGRPQLAAARFAPTWSYLSMIPGPGISLYPMMGEICIAKLLDVKCEVLGSDETGQIASGSIRLASRLHRGTVEQDPDCPKSSSTGSYIKRQWYRIRDDTGSVHDYFYLDHLHPDVIEGKQLFCLELLGSLHNEVGSDEKPLETCTSALVLTRIEGDGPEYYERVGMVFNYRFKPVPIDTKVDKWQEVEIR